MKVLFLTLGNIGIASSRVRVYQYLKFLREAGIGCRVIFYTHPAQADAIMHARKIGLFEKLRWKVFSVGRLIGVLSLSLFYDVVFIQKVVPSKLFLSLLRATNKRIVFDFDDAVYLRKDLTDVLKTASTVIAGNATLHERISRSGLNVHTLPSPVPIPSGDPGDRPKKNRIVIGWIGSPGTSIFLAPLKEVLLKLKERISDLHVQFIGADRSLGKPGFEVIDWDIASESEQVGNFDIGIMPLPDTELSGGKCGYKILQYMAAGIPAVASPVGVNREFIHDGINGFLAGSSEEWSDRLSTLLEDKGLRVKMGEAGRRMAQDYSYSAMAPKLITLLKACAAGEKKRYV